MTSVEFATILNAIADQDDDLVTLLVRALSDESGSVRAASARVLYRVDPCTAYTEIEKALEEEENKAVRASFQGCLRAINPILQVKRNDRI